MRNQQQYIKYNQTLLYMKCKMQYILIIQLLRSKMGLCMNREKQPQVQPRKNNKKSQVQNVDVVKLKLKQARDTINNFLNKKEADIAQVNKKLKEQIPQYQKTGNKKKILPLLQAKKDLEKMAQNCQVRLKLVSEKLHEVQLSQVDAATIDVLDSSNNYIQQIHDELQKKDWQNVIETAKNRVEMKWPEQQDIEDDPAFQEMWKELGGDKIPAKKTVNVNTNVHSNTQKQQGRQQMLA